MDDFWDPAVAEQPEEAFEEGGRPGCLSVFAVLLAVSGIVYGIIFGILGIDLIVEQPDRPVVGAMITVCAAAWLPVPVVVSVGLWRMRMWAWWVAVIVQSLGIGLALLSFGAALVGVDPARALGFVLGPLMGLVASGIILYWFLTNRDHFGKDRVVRTGDQVTKEPASDNRLVIVAAIVIGVVAILCLLSVAVIAILTLLGPQIGSAFSQITSSLSTPVP